MKVDSSSERPVDRFVFVRMVRHERLHGVEDPPKKSYWQDPIVESLVVGERAAATFEEPPFRRVRTQIGVSYLSVGAHSEQLYRVYAIGSEVWRSRGSVKWTELSKDHWRADFWLGREQNRFAARFENYRRSDSPSETQSAAGIAADLIEPWFWKQLRDRYDRGQDHAAIEYICAYYVNRIAAIQRANPSWKPEFRPDWLQSWLPATANANRSSTQPAQHSDPNLATRLAPLPSQIEAACRDHPPATPD